MSSLKPAPFICVFILLGFGATAIAADFINPATAEQSSPAMTAQEKAHRDIVIDYYRDLIRARHMELRPKFFGAYVQHNPNIPTGFDGIKALFGQQPPINPIPPLVPPVVSVAKGDFAWVVWEREEKNPQDPSKMDHYNFFDIFRFDADGKFAEHWDSAQKNPNPRPANIAALPFALPAPRVLGSRGKLSSEEKKNQQLALVKVKDISQAGHVDRAEKVIAADYIEHDPNIPQGRTGFVSKGGTTPQQREREKTPASLTLVSGPYVMMMWDVKAPDPQGRLDRKDPQNPGAEYTYNHFDMVRIEKGLIQEHWNDLRMNPLP